jgi:hypothetical protein
MYEVCLRYENKNIIRRNTKAITPQDSLENEYLIENFSQKIAKRLMRITEHKVLYILLVSDKFSIFESFLLAEMKRWYSTYFKKDIFLRIGSMTREPILLIIKPTK